MILTYKKAVKLLQSQGKFHINLGLERINRVLKYFDNPQNKIKIIHIAGTNGKGSVCSAIANILYSNGLKTGLYTSPHLVEYTERIKINNEKITQDDFALYIKRICKQADFVGINLTEFEILTSAAFLYFYEKKVDIAVIETGLGGRFDATNTSENKILAVITSISLDHTDRLGDSIEKIAFEKAGIINDYSNVVISAQNKGFDVIEKYCIEHNAKLYTAFDKEIPYKIPLLGLYQTENMSLVLKCVEVLNENGFYITKEAVKKGLETLKWGARLEYLKEKNILIDGAHNPDAALALRKSLDYYFPKQKRTFVYSTLSTKNYKEIAEILFRKEDEIFYIEFNHKDCVLYDDYVKNTKLPCQIEKIDLENLDNVLKKDSLKIVTGSLYMIGSIYKKLKK